MTEDQIQQLGAFARGDLAGPVFEKWFLSQIELENELGEDLHWRLQSENYSQKDIVWALRQDLIKAIEPFKKCECISIKNLDVIPMGSDFYFEKVFESLNEVLKFGSEKWWLYISECSVCASTWLIAQDDRIYDDFFFQRISLDDLAEAKAGRWPDQFLTYEKVLAVGRDLSNPPVFFDPLASSLQWTVEDLIKARPAITQEEISHLLGIDKNQTEALLAKVG